MNKRELDVLSILYRAKRPLIGTEIVNAGRGLTQSTVTAVLRVLKRKDLVEVSGVAYSGKVLSRQYEPTPKAKKAVLEYLADIYLDFQETIPLEELGEYVQEKNADR